MSDLLKVAGNANNTRRSFAWSILCFAAAASHLQAAHRSRMQTKTDTGRQDMTGAKTIRKKESSTSILKAFSLAAEIYGDEMKFEFVDQNRRGDLICYISNLDKMKSHCPDWGNYEEFEGHC